MRKSFVALSEAFDLQMIASSLIALLALFLGARALAESPAVDFALPAPVLDVAK